MLLPDRLKVIVVVAPAAVTVLNDVELLNVVAKAEAEDDEANVVALNFLLFGFFCGFALLKVVRWFL